MALRKRSEGLARRRALAWFGKLKRGRVPRYVSWSFFSIDSVPPSYVLNNGICVVCPQCGASQCPPRAQAALASFGAPEAETSPARKGPQDTLPIRTQTLHLCWIDPRKTKGESDLSQSSPPVLFYPSLSGLHYGVGEVAASLTTCPKCLFFCPLLPAPRPRSVACRGNTNPLHATFLDCPFRCVCQSCCSSFPPFLSNFGMSSGSPPLPCRVFFTINCDGCPVYSCGCTGHPGTRYCVISVSLAPPPSLWYFQYRILLSDC